MTDLPEYWSTKALAERFGVSPNQIKRYVQGVKLGRKRLYRLEDALAALRPAPLDPVPLSKTGSER